jgi:hypothetical protein
MGVRNSEAHFLQIFVLKKNMGPHMFFSPWFFSIHGSMFSKRLGVNLVLCLNPGLTFTVQRHGWRMTWVEVGSLLDI